jgi:hypothetical protein
MRGTLPRFETRIPGQENAAVPRNCILAELHKSFTNQTVTQRDTFIAVVDVRIHGSGDTDKQQYSEG